MKGAGVINRRLGHPQKVNCREGLSKFLKTFPKSHINTTETLSHILLRCGPQITLLRGRGVCRSIFFLNLKLNIFLKDKNEWAKILHCLPSFFFFFSDSLNTRIKNEERSSENIARKAPISYVPFQNYFISRFDHGCWFLKRRNFHV